MDVTNLKRQKTFLDEDFLLEGKYAKILFHDYVKHLPIIDYHNHLSPKEIATDKIFNNISEIWLAGDHYKWRAMRTLGIDEKFITGDAEDWEKFDKWAAAVPYTVRNPLYHWTHLELQRYFDIHELLDDKNARAVYERTSSNINSPDFSTQNILRKMKVEVVCTTDDPADSLEFHQKYRNADNSCGMYPAFRPDKSYAIEAPEVYRSYLDKLSEVAQVSIENYDDLLQALQQRIDYFHQEAGRVADHGLEKLYFFKENAFDIESIFQKVRNGKSPDQNEIEFFKFRTLQALCKMYHAKGWTQQFHLGAIRNNNSRKLAQLGPDTGFDSIGDFSQARELSGFLNALDSTDQLAKTIIYNLNPSDNEVIATMTGNFNDGSIKGKIQFGSGWWFLDQKEGMERQMNTLSNMGLISCFVGMLTDSRSFLSFPRHEYFRRILCNLFGKDMEKGELPQDEQWIGKIVGDISYYNAKNFFQFPK